MTTLNTRSLLQLLLVLLEQPIKLALILLLHSIMFSGVDAFEQVRFTTVMIDTLIAERKRESTSSCSATRL